MSEFGRALVTGGSKGLGFASSVALASAGADVTLVEAPWGRAIDPDDVSRAAANGPFKVLAVVHAETSTGVLQDLAPFRAIADSCGALLLVDAVTSLAGVAVDVDRYGIDAVYSGTQKCLSCTPGLAPISFNERALEKISKRSSKVQSWFLDLNLVMGYWGSGQKRAYHHTAPVNALYGLHEALRLLEEEALKENTGRILATLPVEVATYLLNEKRQMIADIERRHDVSIMLIPNRQLETPKYEIERVRRQDLDTGDTPSHQQEKKLASETPMVGERQVARVEKPAVRPIAPAAPAPQPVTPPSPPARR